MFSTYKIREYEIFNHADKAWSDLPNKLNPCLRHGFKDWKTKRWKALVICKPPSSEGLEKSAVTVVHATNDTEAKCIAYFNDPEDAVIFVNAYAQKKSLFKS